MPLLWLRSFISARRMKFEYSFLLMRNSLCSSVTPSVEPTIMPSFTDHSRGSPSQPSRFLPLNNGTKPSAANAAAANAASRRTFFMTLCPLNLDRMNLHFFQGPILGVARRLRNLLHD